MKPGTTVAERIFPRAGLGIRLFVQTDGALAVRMYDPDVGKKDGTFSIQSCEFADDTRADYETQVRRAEADDAIFEAEDAAKAVAK